MAPEPDDVGFEVGGDRCAARVYRPAGTGPHPCVVMAHGFGGNREGRLWAYAERFREAGLAVLLFDYRHFGASSGEPRLLLSLSRQHADWRAARDHARGLAGIDPGRIALWGTSLSGGHVIKIGAEDGRVAAIVSQNPFASGPAVLRAAGALNVARLSLAGLRDLSRSLRGAEPHRIPVVARPGELGAMTQERSHDGYLALFEDPVRQFPNRVCARFALTIGAYLPGRWARRVRAPLLVLTVPGDTVTPARPAARMARRAPLGRHIAYPGDYDHFDIYVGELFERTVVDQIDFLRERLLG